MSLDRDGLIKAAHSAHVPFNYGDSTDGDAVAPGPPPQAARENIAAAAKSNPDLASATPSTRATQSTPPPASPDASDASPGVVGTVLRFSARSTSVDVTIDEDNPAVRDFLSMLPLTVTVEEFNGREKIADLPRELAHDGSPGSDPEDGDLIYYVPWGNLGFYYNTAGIGYSDETIHLGTYVASLDQLEQLEGLDVTVQVVP